MNYTRIALLLLSIAIAPIARSQVNTQAQKKITVFDFESPLNVQDWWVDNKEIRLSLLDRNPNDKAGNGDPAANGGKCLRIRWDAVPPDRPSVWLTDIKIDTFGDSAMTGAWKSFKENAWLSFSLNTGDGDSVYLQFIIFTKGEKDKWGSRETIGFRSPVWKTVKVKLSDLHFDNWGKGNIATPDLGAIVPARIEIGIRSAMTDQKGKIDLRVDDIVISNYEP